MEGLIFTIHHSGHKTLLINLAVNLNVLYTRFTTIGNNITDVQLTDSQNENINVYNI